jgi:hypothetical protein
MKQWWCNLSLVVVGSGVLWGLALPISAASPSELQRIKQQVEAAAQAHSQATPRPVSTPASSFFPAENISPTQGEQIEALPQPELLAVWIGGWITIWRQGSVWYLSIWPPGSRYRTR